MKQVYCTCELLPDLVLRRSWNLAGKVSTQIPVAVVTNQIPGGEVKFQTPDAA